MYILQQELLPATSLLGNHKLPMDHKTNVVGINSLTQSIEW